MPKGCVSQIRRACKTIIMSLFRPESHDAHLSHNFVAQFFRLPATMNAPSLDVRPALTNTAHSSVSRRTMTNGVFNDSQTSLTQFEDELMQGGAAFLPQLLRGISLDESLLSQTTRSKVKVTKRSTMNMLFGAPLMAPVMIGLSAEVQETKRRANAAKSQQRDDGSGDALSKTPSPGQDSAGHVRSCLVYQRGASPLVVEVRGRNVLYTHNSDPRCRDPYRHAASDRRRSCATHEKRLSASSLQHPGVTILSNRQSSLASGKAGNPLCNKNETSTRNLGGNDEVQGSSYPSVNLKSNLTSPMLIARTA